MDYAKAYGELHANEKYFPGYTVGNYRKAIAKLVEQHRPERLLDFGSGKGFQYLVHRVHESWGGLLPYCYDVGVRQLRDLPEGQFGGVICTDVLEHIEKQDLAGVLAKIFSKCEPTGFVILGISCRPSRKTLPDGRDVHVTVKPPSWWKQFLWDQWTSICGINGRPRLVAHFEVSGHFDEPEVPIEFVHGDRFQK